MDEVKIAIFELNGDILGTDILQISEIVKYQNIKEVPNTPEYVEGFIEIRNSLVPVINLNTKFNLGKTEITKKTKIVVTSIGNNEVGFVVNDVTRILNVSKDEVENVPDIIFSAGREYIKIVVKKDNQLIAVLDIVELLSEDEIKYIKKVKKEYNETENNEVLIKEENKDTNYSKV